MSGVYLTWLADALRDAGLTVIEYAGWQTRARSSGGYSDASRPWGVMWHHTASSPSWDGQKDADYIAKGDEDAPLANLYLDRSGAVWVLAAGATNTNGKGNAITWSKGTVPANSMNSYALGVEMGNNGVGEPWPQAQVDAMFKVSNVVNARLGNRPDDLCTHQHYAPDRKVDPATAYAVQGTWTPRSCTGSGTWNCDDIRVECERRANEPEDDMPSAQEIATAVWAEPCVSEVDGETYAVGTFIHSIHGLAYQGVADAVWQAEYPSQDPDQNGQPFPTQIYLTAIHQVVVDIQKRLTALEGKT